MKKLAWKLQIIDRIQSKEQSTITSQKQTETEQSRCLVFQTIDTNFDLCIVYIWLCNK